MVTLISTTRPGPAPELAHPTELGLVPAWSISTLDKFETCAYQVYIAKVKKIPEPQGDAAARGETIHKAAENFVNGTTPDLIPELKKYEALFDELKAAFTRGEVEQEGGAVHVKFLDRFVSVPLKEKMVFARNLAVMVSSGLTIVRAVYSLSLQTKNKTFKKILADVHGEVEQGKTLSEGLAKYPTVFSELFVSMIYVGEVSGNLEQVLVPAAVIGDRMNYLKEGIDVKAMCYGPSIFSVELPQFLELVVVKTETAESASPLANATKIAALETGAKIDVPLFVETGDIVKVDTHTNEYIQRV